MWVPPFGYRRINSCLQIPGAFRSLPRPSSLLEAKASSVRSSSLSRTFKWINFATFFSLKFVLLVLPMKLQSSSQLEKTRIYLSDLISFSSLPRYLSQYCQWSLVFPSLFGRDCKGTNYFWTCKFFFTIFLKNSSFSRTPIYSTISTYDLYSIY